MKKTEIAVVLLIACLGALFVSSNAQQLSGPYISGGSGGSGGGSVATSQLLTVTGSGARVQLTNTSSYTANDLLTSDAGSNVQDSGCALNSGAFNCGTSAVSFTSTSASAGSLGVFSFVDSSLTALAGNGVFVAFTPSISSGSTHPSSLLFLNPTLNHTAANSDYLIRMLPTLTSVGAYSAISEGPVTANITGTAAQYENDFGLETLAAGSTTTVGTAATLHISGAPAAGTNVTITNPYAILVDSGTVQAPTVNATTGYNVNGSALAFSNLSGSISSGQLPSQYKTLSCQPGLGDGVNALAVASYLQSTCYNDYGVTFTITDIKCYTDNSGSSTLNATNGAGTGLLTGAISCSPSFASGMQSATTTIAAGDFIKFTFAADGATKQTTWVVTGTH